MGKTFVEKIFNATSNAIVFVTPDIVLTHDNTVSIAETFKKMGGQHVYNPDQLLIVLDHNAPPTGAALANDYQKIRDFAHCEGIRKFHDAGEGICHQIMSTYAKPGMIIVGSDSHTCTAGAFNAFAAGIDRTEAAGLWKQGETWFRVPQTIKITLTNKLPKHVYAKDLALWIIGMIGSDGADYMSIEFHGEGVKTLSIPDRMTLANLTSEMGAKNAVFPADEVLEDFLGQKVNGITLDDDAHYFKEINIDLSKLFPVVSAPHHVDNVKAVAQVKGIKLHQALIGTCTNGRLEDLRQAAEILDGHIIPDGFQLLIIPASKQIFLDAMREGLIETFLLAGANVLSPSCGPCLGTGQGIPADNFNVISTANRNFKGRMGNKEASIYLASPATVAYSALKGEIADPRGDDAAQDIYPYEKKQSATLEIQASDNRYEKHVWNYADIDNMNTDQMFAGNLTYEVKSAEPEKIKPHLLAGVDTHFAEQVSEGDVIVAGWNFGCGSSREHPAVGMAYVGIKAVICKSVNRIFYRSAINQGLPIIVLPQAVEAYKPGDAIYIDFERGIIHIQSQEFAFTRLPDKLMKIFQAKGLANYLKNN
ncbi:MAG: aconitase/3-isopropylmalate dehydratase large subunit family protein [Bacteroidales bacterium]|jgi:3-isopropylmalate/(R)-2-methylmalate dehydratase large subunit|nr:aconitase/3-isopropylmalate dehydratase large subunit family protein [Bacteroidales bacterium]MDD2688158.1 aconitase/3-isopropylmalate dehydratase large subunit family protein [Bacteroidales bacterium]MDD3331222.1 aconitase/3-isopropylmalate dehydratase large subunit family protein [Bacteroidales bacterium]MDD3690896.1 aconitase/3-isopropylmalate dehydratase large subunit family protein [Bacteroidales bacterium]MDD4044381.1 aconitase/3-isopropylmalate dehydratase large subunit family protein